MKKSFKQRLRDLGVSVAYLFGSRASGSASPISDVDIGIVLKDPPSERDTRSVYQSLYELFSEIMPSDKLDIVFLQRSPLPLQYFAVRDGRLLFEGDPIFTADYENRVINLYLDFRPVLDLFDQVTSERYAEA